MRKLLWICLALFSINASAQEKILNVYAWAGEIPDTVVKQFEQETGIKVNLSTYENNEIMYAKLRALKHAGYDVINPSSYYIDRMRRQQMIQPLDKSKLSNIKNLNPALLKAAYDPGANYSLPHVMGVTGIFVNDKYFDPKSVQRWSDFWDKRFVDQLMLLDDTREVFSIALMDLGYSVNDRDPAHIREAYLLLKKLMQNVKVFSSETVTSILIDEDATVGMAWNGDVFKATKENSHVKFVFPKDGYVVWVDNLAIPTNAPHLENAYLFLNFMMRPEIAKEVALATNFSTPNLAAQRLLPENIRNNPIIYPSKSVIANGQFQTDVGDDTLTLLEKYWEQLKMGA